MCLPGECGAFAVAAWRERVEKRCTKGGRYLSPQVSFLEDGGKVETKPTSERVNVVVSA